MFYTVMQKMFLHEDIKRKFKPQFRLLQEGLRTFKQTVLPQSPRTLGAVVQNQLDI